MSEQSPTQVEEQAAFSVRGGHLEYFVLFTMIEGIDPRDGAIAVVNGLKSAIKNKTANRGYAAGLIGPAGQGAEKLTDTLSSFAGAFLNLPDDSPVEITQSEDQLCGGCFNNAHCHNRGRDSRYINHFLVLADALEPKTSGKTDQPKKFGYAVVFADAHDDSLPRQELVIRTTAKVVRQIIGHPDFTHL